MGRSRIAFLIGIQRYASGDITGVDHDVAALRDLLVSKCDFSALPSDLLVPQSNELCYSALDRSLDAWFERLSGDEPPELALLYFAGHGRIEGGRAELAFLGDRSFEDWWPATRLLQVKPRCPLLIVLDCCHAGAVLDEKTAAAVAPQVGLLGACSRYEGTPARSPLTAALLDELGSRRGSPREVLMRAAARVGAPTAWTSFPKWSPRDAPDHLNPGAPQQHGSPTDLGAPDVLRRKVLDDHARFEDALDQWTPCSLERLYVKRDLHAEGQPLLYPLATDALVSRAWDLTSLLDEPTDEARGVTGCWVVTGHPGTGKTTLLRETARQLAGREGRAVPVYASLARLAARGGGDLLDALAARQPAPRSHAAWREVLDRAGRAGELVALLDGLDEVEAGRRELTRQIRDLAASWSASRFVVSSRVVDYEAMGGRFRELEIHPLDEEQQRDLLRRRLGTDPDALQRAEDELFGPDGAAFADLLGNPLYLSLVAVTYLAGERPERRRARFLQQVVTILVEGRHRKQTRAEAEANRDTRDPEGRTHLQALATRMVDQGAIEVPADEVAASEDARRHLRRSGLVGPYGEGGSWCFRHRALAEVLAAEALRPRFEAHARWTTEWATLPWWRRAWRWLTRSHRSEWARWVEQVVPDRVGFWGEPLALMCGLADRPEAVVRALFDASQPLGLSALATADVSRETLMTLVGLTEDLEERRSTLLGLAARLDAPERALALLGRFEPASPEDVWFLTEALEAIGTPEAHQAVRALYARFAEPDPEALAWCDIPAGTFWMGSAGDVGDRDEHPRHQVEISEPFRLGRTTVTNGDMRRFWAGWGGDEDAQLPAREVTWYAARAYCRWLHPAARLPTEAEWEYACRAGADGKRDLWCFGDDPEALGQYAWFGDNSQRVQPVGGRTANRWGLHDMHGNVWEWCMDWALDSYRDRSGQRVELGAMTSTPLAGATRTYQAVPVDPTGPPRGVLRVLRGGCFWVTAGRCRSAYRLSERPAATWNELGFRVRLPAAPSSGPRT